MAHVIIKNTIIMNRFKTLPVLLAALIVSMALNAQDVRTLETRVADLLARMPAENQNLAARLMEEMYSLGDEGMNRICDQVVPAGTGDDTRARYAVSTLTAYLSGEKDIQRKKTWEDLCIRFVNKAATSDVRSFFIRQLNLIGSDTAVEALKKYLLEKDVCDDIVMALQSIGSDRAMQQLESALSEEICPCAAQAMDALAEKHYGRAVQCYLKWYEEGSRAEKSAALYAMASTADPAVMPVLMKAAGDAGYRWDPTGAVNALLLWARNAGLEGRKRDMKKVTDIVMASCNTTETSGQRVAAMSVLTEVEGKDALPVLLEAAGDPDVAVRGGALRLASLIPGKEATAKWIRRYSKVRPEVQPEILFMLGERGDNTAVPLVLKAMDNSSHETAVEAVTALARLQGHDAVDPIISWILRYDNEEGHRAAANALTTILDSTGMKKIAASLPASKGHSTVALIWLLAWSGDNRYFDTVLSYAGSADPGISSAAITSLAALASADDQPALLSMLEKATDRQEIAELQRAVASAALKSEDPAKRSAVILEALDKGGDRLRLIPLLSQTGGEEALRRVAREFENGNAETRDVCFDALAHWSDHYALRALLDICASGNKTFGMPAFDAYLRMVSSAAVTPERKLLYLKDIAEFAAPPDARMDIISLAASLDIRQAVFFISPFLSDQAEEVRSAAQEAIRSMDLPDEVFEPMFNGRDLTGWKGLVGNPITRAAMKPKELDAKQKEADQKMLGNWSVRDGMIWFSGTGDNLCSVKDYGDFELYVDWRITKKGDSGIYLRGSPQVQIWDTSRTDAGAQVGSGGLYNNEKNPSVPLKVADNPVGEWNTFRIVMTGNKVSVWLNGELVTDNVTMENYWDRTIPIFEKGPVELQAHGTDLNFRDIYIREISPAEYNLTPEEKAEGFVSLFNGRNLDGWTGNKVSYGVEDGMIVIRPGDESGGNLYTEKEYSDFVFRFEFQLTPGANNGLGIRAPLEGDAAYVGMELQILDNTAAIYANLQPYQYHGSVYGVIPAKRGYLKPVGEWNYEEVTASGTRIKVVLNGSVIVDGDIAEAAEKGTIDGKDHPGLRNISGHIGFLGHGSLVKFRNIRIRVLH